MATIYGDITNHWRCYINTWSSEDATSVSAGLTVGIQDCGWGFQIWTGIVGDANANGSKSVVNTSFNTSTGSWSTKDITSASQRFTKGHNAYDIWLSGTVTNKSGYMNGSSSATQYLTIPALAHHYVTFDANGGTGAPGRVDKWYGEQVTIPTTKPTRTNYEFLGWSTTRDGQVAYKPGEKYWIDDVDATYYAVWKLLYVPPKFTNGLAIRTSSMTSTTHDYSGGYCYASFSYKVDTTIYPSNVAKSIVCKYYQDGNSTGVTVTPTGDLNKASGTVNVHFAASINSVYYIECSLTDTKDGTATIARSITTGVLPMEVANQGRSVGILSAAPSSDGLKLGGSGNPDFLIAADTTNNRLESMAQIHGRTSSAGQGELTLSVDGLDYNGNHSSGKISFNAARFLFNSYDLDAIMSAPAYDGNAAKPSSPHYLKWGVIRLPSGLCIMSLLENNNWSWVGGVIFSRTTFELPIPLASTTYNVVYSQMYYNTLDYINQVTIQTEWRKAQSFGAVSYHPTTNNATYTFNVQPIVIGQWK
uniref:Uncharacterized protein n=1 Tax=Siphoviridae sp. ctMsr1 TaxID=2826264 RepID=A0A8S5LVE6_9CAUD|nr:MAG TPA: hypothetical protein [Siphoviridae sp. ctMsr1]